MLVLRPGALGDTLLAVPALRALRTIGAPLTLAAHAGASRLLAQLGEIDHGIAFDDASLSWVFNGQAPGQPVVAWMTPSEFTPGLRNAQLLAASRPDNEQHCARYLLETLSCLDVEAAFDDRPFRVTPIASQEILIHPGSGAAAKNWPAERFAAVIRGLDSGVRLIVGEADSAAAGAVEHSLGRHLPRLEGPPLDVLAARLAGCRAYLGNDSGVSHLAGLAGARTFALFGPTNPAVWRPIGASVAVVPFEIDPTELAKRL